MKKGILLIVILAILSFVLVKFIFKKEEAEIPKAEPIAVNSSDTLTNSIAKSLQAYFDLKDAFVKSDTSLVNNVAGVFAGKIDSVEMKMAKADTSLVQLAMELQQNISLETKNILAATGMEAKRKSFQVLSDALFDLLRTVRYSGSKVYQQFCPMAFNNTGAAWLSNSTEIFNPYFGDKMLNCGEVRDSVNIAPIP